MLQSPLPGYWYESREGGWFKRREGAREEERRGERRGTEAAAAPAHASPCTTEPPAPGESWSQCSH